MNKELKYRPEIDGLRAVSVLGVIFFHAGLGVGGGFVGVDVFFVISGFLISGIICRQLESGSFSLKQFWWRRIKRIVPASAVAVIATLFVGLWLVEPEGLASLAKSALANVAMASNIYFWRNTGYFQLEAEMMPLLHTWSLAVEEQFYLIFPLVLLCVFRVKRKWIVGLIIIGGGVSLGLSMLTLNQYPGATFFLLPTRAWELLCGALISVGCRHYRPGKWIGEGCSALGLATIAYCMFIYDMGTSFPGVHAVPPVFGACLVIIGNQGRLSSSGRLLAWKPLVLIGLMSYSLYLWHWPVVVLSKYVIATRGLLSDAASLIFIFGLGYLSWRFVEKPFRYETRLKSFKASVGFWVSSGAATSLLAGLMIWQGGFPDRFAGKMEQLIADIHWNGAERHSVVSPEEQLVLLGDVTASEKPTFVLWGDSHGLAVTDLWNRLGNKYGVCGVALLSSGTPPLIGVSQPNKDLESQLQNANLTRKRFKWLLGSNVENVVLIARWNFNILGYAETESHEIVNHGRFAQVIAEPKAEDTSQVEAARVLGSALRKQVEALVLKGKRVWIIKQVPLIDRGNAARSFAAYKRFPKLNKQFNCESIRREDYLNQRKVTDDIFDSLKIKDVKIVDPLDAFFGKRDQLLLYGDRAYYKDEDHLTRAGAEYYLADLFEGMIMEFEKKTEEK